MSSIDRRIVSIEMDNQQFEKAANNTMATLGKLEQSMQFKNSTTNLDALEKSLSNVNFDALNSALDKVNDGFSVMGVMAKRVIEDITDSLYSFVKSGVSNAFNATIGQIKSGGWTRTSNIAQAKHMLKGLGVAWEDVKDSIDYAVQDTAYGVDEASRIASQFLASGVQTGEDMNTALRAVSGTAAMTNSSYLEMGDIFAKVAGNGKVMAVNLNQLAVRGLNGAATLAKYLEEVQGMAGVTEAEVRSMVSEGAIDFQMFADAMDWAFGEHAKDANETFEGVTANIRAALSRIGQGYTDPLRENLTYFFQDVLQMTKAIEKAVKPIAKPFEKMFITLFGTEGIFSGIASGIERWTWQFMDDESLLKTMKSIWGDDIVDLYGSEAATVEAGRRSWRGEWDEATQSYTGYAPYKQIKIIETFQNIADKLSDWRWENFDPKKLPDKIDHMVNTLSEFFGPLVNGVHGLFDFVNNNLDNIKEFFNGFFTPITERLKSFFALPAYNPFDSEAISAVADEISDVVSTIEERLGLNREDVDAIIRGDYGNGQERIKNLLAANKNYWELQDLVNYAINGTTTSLHELSDAELLNLGYTQEQIDSLRELYPETEKTADAVDNLLEMANKVIRGDFGNGQERYQALTDAGENYWEIQDKVNEMMGCEIGSLHSLSDEQLLNLGYTQEQIDAMRALYAEYEAQAAIEEEMKKRKGLYGVITGLRDAIVFLLDTWESFKQAFVNTKYEMGSILNLSDVIDEFGAAFYDVGKWLTGINQTKIGKAFQNILTVISRITRVAVVLIGFVRRAVSAILPPLLKILGSIGSTILDIIGYIAGHDGIWLWFEIAIETITGVFEALGIILSSVADKVAGFFDSIANSPLAVKARNIFDGLYDSALSFLGLKEEGSDETVISGEQVGLLERAHTVITDMLTAIRGFFGYAADGTKIEYIDKSQIPLGRQFLDIITAIPSKIRAFFGLNDKWEKIEFADGDQIPIGRMIIDFFGKIGKKLSEFNDKFKTTDELTGEKKGGLFTFFLARLADFGSFVLSAGTGILDFLGGLVETIANSQGFQNFVGLMSELGSTIAGWAGGIWDKIYTLFFGKQDAEGGVVGAVQGIRKIDFNKIGKDIGEKLGGAFSWVTEKVEAFRKKIQEIRDAFRIFNDKDRIILYDENGDPISSGNKILDFLDKLKAKFAPIKKWLDDKGITGAISKFVGDIGDLVDKINPFSKNAKFTKDGIPIVPEFNNKNNNAVLRFLQTLRERFESVKEIVLDIVPAFQKFFDKDRIILYDDKGDPIPTGNKVLDFLDKINAKVQEVKNRIKDFVGDIRKTFSDIGPAFKTFFSKDHNILFDENGNPIPTGNKVLDFLNNLKIKLGEVKDKIKNFSLKDFITGLPDKFKEFKASFDANIKEKGFFGWLSDLVKNSSAYKKASEIFNNTIGKIVDTEAIGKKLEELDPIGWLKDKITNSSIYKTISEFFGGIMTRITGWYNMALATVTGWVDGIQEKLFGSDKKDPLGISGFIETHFNIPKIIEDKLNAATDGEGIFSIVSGWFSGIFDKFSSFTFPWDKQDDKEGGIGGAIKNAVNPEAIKETFTSIGAENGGGIIGFLKGVWESIVAWFTGFKASSVVTALGSAFSNIFSSAFTAAGEMLSSAPGALKGLGGAIWGTILDIFTVPVEGGEEGATRLKTFSELFGPIGEALTAIWNSITGIFSSVKEGDIAGTEAKTDEAGGLFSGMINSFTTFIDNIVGIGDSFPSEQEGGPTGLLGILRNVEHWIAELVDNDDVDRIVEQIKAGSIAVILLQIARIVSWLGGIASSANVLLKFNIFAKLNTFAFNNLFKVVLAVLALMVAGYVMMHLEPEELIKFWGGFGAILLALFAFLGVFKWYAKGTKGTGLFDTIKTVGVLFASIIPLAIGLLALALVLKWINSEKNSGVKESLGEFFTIIKNVLLAMVGIAAVLALLKRVFKLDVGAELTAMAEMFTAIGAAIKSVAVAIAWIVGVAVVFALVKKILPKLDVEGALWTVVKIALGLGAFILAMALIFKLTDSKNMNDNAFKEIGNVLKSTAIAIGILAAVAVALSLINTWGVNVWKGIGMLAAIVAGILTIIVAFALISKALTSGEGKTLGKGAWFKNLLSRIGALVLVAGAIFALVKIIESMKNLQNLKAESAVPLAVAFGAIVLLSVIVSFLSAIPAPALWSAVGVIAVLGVIVGAIIWLLTEMAKVKLMQTIVDKGLFENVEDVYRAIEAVTQKLQELGEAYGIALIGGVEQITGAQETAESMLTGQSNTFVGNLGNIGEMISGAWNSFTAPFTGHSVTGAELDVPPVLTDTTDYLNVDFSSAIQNAGYDYDGFMQQLSGAGYDISIFDGVDFGTEQFDTTLANMGIDLSQFGVDVEGFTGEMNGMFTSVGDNSEAANSMLGALADAFDKDGSLRKKAGEVLEMFTGKDGEGGLLNGLEGVKEQLVGENGLLNSLTGEGGLLSGFTDIKESLLGEDGLITKAQTAISEGGSGLLGMFLGTDVSAAELEGQLKEKAVSIGKETLTELAGSSDLNTAAAGLGTSLVGSIGQGIIDAINIINPFAWLARGLAITYVWLENLIDKATAKIEAKINAWREKQKALEAEESAAQNRIYNTIDTDYAFAEFSITYGYSTEEANAMADKVGSLMELAGYSVEDAMAAVLDGGADQIIAGLAKGLEDNKGDVVGPVQQVADIANTTLEDKMKMHSPSKLWASYGSNLIAGLAAPFNSSIELRTLFASVSKLVVNLNRQITIKKDSFRDAGKTLINALIEAIRFSASSDVGHAAATNILQGFYSQRWSAYNAGRSFIDNLELGVRDAAASLQNTARLTANSMVNAFINARDAALYANGIQNGAIIANVGLQPTSPDLDTWVSTKGMASDYTTNLASVTRDLTNAAIATKNNASNVYNDSGVINAITGVQTKLDALESTMSSMGVYIDGNVLAGEIAPNINRRLGYTQTMQRRGNL